MAGEGGVVMENLGLTVSVMAGVGLGFRSSTEGFGGSKANERSRSRSEWGEEGVDEDDWEDGRCRAGEALGDWDGVSSGLVGSGVLSQVLSQRMGSEQERKGKKSKNDMGDIKGFLVGHVRDDKRLGYLQVWMLFKNRYLGFNHGETITFVHKNIGYIKFVPFFRF